MRSGEDGRAGMDEELAYHLERLEEEYRAQGLDGEAARRAALERFGDVARVERACAAIERETTRRHRRRDWLGELRQDVVFAIRQLASRRLATLVSVVTLALGIGATTAIFSVVSGVLLRPLPYPDGDRLMAGVVSIPDARDVRERTRVFDGTAVWASNLYTIRDADRPEEVRGAVVEPSFFTLLGGPALGRAFDVDAEAGPVVVISHGLWQRRFGSDAGVIGRMLDLNGVAHVITGVMPRAFDYPDARFDAWVPLAWAMRGHDEQVQNRALRIFRLVGRRAPGVAESAVATELGAVSDQLAAEHPETNTGIALRMTALREQIVGDVRPALLALFGAVALVLFIACANVASLQVGQRAARGPEMAIRVALGAGRLRLVRQLLTESLVLATIGGLAGVALAAGALELLPASGLDLPRAAEIGLDGGVLAFTVVATLLTAVLFGTAPALHGTARVEPAMVLREGGRSGTAGRARGRLRAVLAGSEVGLAVVVLVAAGLLVRSLSLLLDADLGFEPAGLISLNVGLSDIEEGDERARTLERVLQSIASVPGVIVAGAGSGLPPQTAQRLTAFAVPGRVPDADRRDEAYWIAATPGWFEALGTRVVRGRAFGEVDRREGLPVVILSEGLARSLFGESDPVGRTMRLLDPTQQAVPRTIVGVVEDVRYQGIEDDFATAVYTPFSQTPFTWSYVMVRSALGADRLARPLRDAVHAVDSRLVPARVDQHAVLVSELVAQRRFLTLLLSAFALLALLLAAIGVYGVIASGVAQRRREIGVRVALGARRGHVIRQIVLPAMALVTLGLGGGLLASVWLMRLLGGLLYDVGATDPVTFAVGATVIVVVGLLASALPALRAAATDPATVLRE